MRASLYRILLSLFSPGCLAACLACLVLLAGGAAHAARAKPVVAKGFETPEAAVAALVDALRTNDHEGLASVLGDERLTPRAQEEDRADVAVFLRSFDAKHSLDRSRPEVAVLSVGEDNWIFPVPVRFRGNVWRFDTQAGMREIFNRRIGRNELLTIEALRAYVEAQRDFAARKDTGQGTRQFACRFVSDSEKENGLYWQPKPGGEESPVGQLMAQAARDECQALGIAPAPFHGYYFKILSRQGRNAPGGSYDYFAGKDMVLGFACVAYPEKYGLTGVMTFVVNQDGVVHQKDLGKRTAAAAGKMKEYNPDKTWAKAEFVPPVPAPPAPSAQ